MAVSPAQIAATRRYQDKHYSQINVRLSKELTAAWNAKLKASGQSRAGFIRDCITEYLEGGLRV
ncbi:MAG: ribbon-helix-helix protein, CopG family [Treponema sp.]|jgi:predicted HicB family RNase H-like nuclease|nr:ribbon-helix-helix protein, CopG family [Treponema sp.]